MPIEFQFFFGVLLLIVAAAIIWGPEFQLKNSAHDDLTVIGELFKKFEDIDGSIVISYSRQTRVYSVRMWPDGKDPETRLNFKDLKELTNWVNVYLESREF